MTFPNKNQFNLLVVFYKSTLTLNIACSILLGILALSDFLLAFGICFLSAGTVISLLYQEISRQHEYYFYYNKGISKLWLVAGCVTGNFVIGLLFIVIPAYVKHS